MPAIISSTMVPRTCSLRQLLAVELGLEQKRRQVVAGLSPVLGDALVHVVVDLAGRDHRLALLGRHVDVLEDLMDEPPEDVGVLLRKAEHADDHPHRDVLGVVDGGIELGRGRPLASSSSPAQFAGEGLEGRDAFRCERRQQHAPGHGVERAGRR